jgi:hypothetical protein
MQPVRITGRVAPGTLGFYVLPSGTSLHELPNASELEKYSCNNEAGTSADRPSKTLAKNIFLPSYPLSGGCHFEHAFNTTEL